MPMVLAMRILNWPSTKEKEIRAEKEAIDAQVQKERANLPGSVMISDAFFPFRDGADVGIAQGISAILQAGGSHARFRNHPGL